MTLSVIEKILIFKYKYGMNNEELSGVIADMKIRIEKLNITGIEIPFGSGGKKHE